LVDALRLSTLLLSLGSHHAFSGISDRNALRAQLFRGSLVPAVGFVGWISEAHPPIPGMVGNE